MKLLLRLIICIFLFVIVATGVSYLLIDKTDTDGSISKQTILERVLGREKESPYSIRWGTLLSCIVDQQGIPVVDAKVTLAARLKKDCDGHPTEEPPAWHCTSVRTNEKGEFVIPPEVWENDPNEKQRITACIKADGFLHRDVTLGQNWGSENDGKIDIFRSGRIEGVLIDPNGLPVANAPIRLDTSTQHQNPAESSHGSYAGKTVTDEHGAFVFEKVPPGQHFVKFPGSFYNACNPDPEEKKKKVPFKEYMASQRVYLEDGLAKTDVFLDLRQSDVTVTGRVVDEYNRPMAGVEVQVCQKVILYNDNGYSTSTHDLKSARTDENGSYVLSHLPAGDYQLNAAYPYEKGKNYKAGDSINIYLSGSQKLAFDLVLQRQDGSLPKPAYDAPLFETPLPDDMGPHELMIVDKSGVGITGATVEFEKRYRSRDSHTYQEWDGATVTTDQQGRLTLPQELQSDDDEKISCRMMIRAEGYDSRHVLTDFWRVKKDPRIDLLRRANIKGRVLDKNGQISDGSVEVVTSMRSFKNPQTSTCGGHYLSNTFSDGEFEVKGLSEGVHILRFKSHGDGQKCQSVGAVVVYLQGEDIDDLTVDMASVCCIRGRVLDGKGDPVSKATVRLQKEIRLGQPYGSTSWPEIAASEPTNRRGEYVIENIIPGVYQLEAVRDDKQRKTSDRKSIGLSGDRPVELDLRLKP